MAGTDRSLIAHLFRRTGFGARPAEISYYAKLSYTTAVNDLLAPRPLMGGEKLLNDDLAPLVRGAWNLYGRLTPRGLADIQIDWLTAMATTTTPLVERMTLMLHDHFATGWVPSKYVDTQELAAQNQLFRTHALGNWATLCHAILEDVAMGGWLDSILNAKDALNENLARELMELFMIGINGGYTEHDVRQAARALTGYYLNTFNTKPLGPRYAMAFDAARHDDGIDMSVFSSPPRNLMPHDVVDILLAQPAASQHLARRLIETFVAPNPASAFVERIAGTLRSRNWEMKPALRAIFTSNEFINARGTIVRSPAEFIAGAIRALGVTDYQTTNIYMNGCGQMLFNPPNVGGWIPNEGWLSAGELLARYNSGAGIATLSANQFRGPGQAAPRGNSVDEWAAIFGLTELSAATRNALQSYLDQATAQKLAQAAIDHGMITLVISSPEFSLA